ncbi:SDR family NAD(P)-dependent oxidoreductase [Halalkalibacter urbisdiaboli]|uniref:SDR family NAD(P)-dependent oxidoreductase n=1 Tax=Halalkalibacter urbisdiaboli TaxID=1960589 RepID=UPI000B4527EA|nr:SDR family oxidoreductase [Halalkalibacter urbisdiaboli]
MKKRVVIITGAGQGIGEAVAKAYGRHGDCVIVADLNEQAANQTAEAMMNEGSEAHAVVCDVRKEEHIIELVRQVELQFERIDVLVNNAGIARASYPNGITLEQWDNIINTNLRGAFLCTREVAKVMKKHQKGSIVNIASTRAFMSEPDSEAYAASKGGLIALTHASAASLQQDRIQVNSISPGWIHTGDEMELRAIDHDQHFSKRVGKPSDIARACLFLTNPDNDFITAENITIDGGMTKKMIYEH